MGMYNSMFIWIEYEVRVRFFLIKKKKEVDLVDWVDNE